MQKYVILCTEREERIVEYDYIYFLSVSDNFDKHLETTMLCVLPNLSPENAWRLEVDQDLTEEEQLASLCMLTTQD